MGSLVGHALGMATGVPLVVAEGARDAMLGPSDGLTMDSQELDSEALSPGDSGYCADRLDLGNNPDSLVRCTLPDNTINEAYPRHASQDRLYPV